VLYNSLKRGLDANTEQVASITPGVKVGFEQKYVLRLITTLVTNAWMSIQLLNYGIEIEKMAFTKTKLALNHSGIKLKDSTFNLPMGLIRSADERMYYIDRSLSEGMTDAAQNLPLLQLPFQHNESTLMERLRKLKWPMWFKIKHFNKNRDLLDLHLTQTKEIQHKIMQLVQNHGKNHCAFCYQHQTTYGCKLCKVLLCKTQKKGSSDSRSCFGIWHNTVGLLEERDKCCKDKAISDTCSCGSTKVETRNKQGARQTKQNTRKQQQQSRQRGRTKDNG